MTKVKKDLTGLQICIVGKDTSGNPVTLYLSNEVTGILHVRLRGEDIHFEPNLLPNAFTALYPVDGCRHGGTF